MSRDHVLYTPTFKYIKGQCIIKSEDYILNLSVKFDFFFQLIFQGILYKFKEIILLYD